MNSMDLLNLLKDVVGIALLPLSYFAWRILQEFKDGHGERESLKGIIRSTSEQSAREHAQIVQALKETQDLIRVSERDNRLEHKELADTIHDIDKNNTREHAILSNGGKL